MTNLKDYLKCRKYVKTYNWRKMQTFSNFVKRLTNKIRKSCLLKMIQDTNKVASFVKKNCEFRKFSESKKLNDSGCVGWDHNFSEIVDEFSQ